MVKLHLLVIAILVLGGPMGIRAQGPVVADSLSHLPLANASVFGCNGNFIGTSDSKGHVSCATPADYPITLRYMGFHEKSVPSSDVDTIFLQEHITELSEIVVESRQDKILHILGYVREYSTLASYTDTITLFREKMVDYMLPSDPKTKYRGWRQPRILKSQSYYRFTDDKGLDSVSAICNQYFTWADWIGIPPEYDIPSRLTDNTCESDTLMGKYSPVEIWNKHDDKLTIDIDILADTIGIRWMPSMRYFLKNDNINFEQFRIHLNYNNINDDALSVVGLTGFSYNIDSRGRGRGMFQFNRYDEPFFVTTYTEVYIVDREYITVKEAKKWEKHSFGNENIDIIESPDAPALHPEILTLIARVNNIDNDSVRMSQPPDYRLAGHGPIYRSLGYRALQLLKVATGISRLKANNDMNRRWNEFKRQQVLRNRQKE